MLAEERHRHIIDLLARRGSLRVGPLAKELSVTEETIRRDFEKLQEDGRLRRIHGGALPTEEPTGDTPFWYREHVLEAEKRAIAAVAVEQLRPHQRIMLDASSTAWFVAEALPMDLPLTVVTNSLTVSLSLSERPDIRLILLGGQVSSATLGCDGPATLEMLEHYHVHTLFLSCRKVDSQGMSEGDEATAALRRAMIEAADRSFLLADHSKLGQRSFAHVAGLERLDACIVDAAASPEAVRDLSETGCRVLVAATN